MKPYVHLLPVMLSGILYSKPSHSMQFILKVADHDLLKYLHNPVMKHLKLLVCIFTNPITLSFMNPLSSLFSLIMAHIFLTISWHSFLLVLHSYHHSHHSWLNPTLHLFHIHTLVDKYDRRKPAIRLNDLSSL